MHVYFSTVKRSAPVEKGGAVCKLDWSSKTVLQKRDLYPAHPNIIDPNPRGNSRGGRGIIRHDNRIFVATYHSIEVLDERLTPVGLITDFNFAGIHEISSSKNHLMIASTASNVAAIYDLASEKVSTYYWPAEDERLMSRLQLKVTRCERKDVDNRLNYLELHNRDKEGHLHLNAVDFSGSHYYALLNKPGAICRLDDMELMVRHEYLEGAHNLLFTGPTKALIVSTRCGLLLEYDVVDNGIAVVADLNDTPFSHGYTRKESSGLRGLLRRNKGQEEIAKKLFWRGLDVSENSVFVGTSPAAILEFEKGSYRYLNYYQYSDDVREAIHGVCVADAGGL